MADFAVRWGWGTVTSSPAQPLNIPQHLRVIRPLVQCLRRGLPKLHAEICERRRYPERMRHVVGGAHVLGHQAQRESVGKSLGDDKLLELEFGGVAPAR